MDKWEWDGCFFIIVVPQLPYLIKEFKLRMWDTSTCSNDHSNHVKYSCCDNQISYFSFKKFDQLHLVVMTKLI
jgi:hypothetical protein